jgi:hypothetical protein
VRSLSPPSVPLTLGSPTHNFVSPPGSLPSDYHGARSAGLHSFLIRRAGDWSEGAKRTASEDLDGVEVVGSLADAVEIVQKWNQDR